MNPRPRRRYRTVQALPLSRCSLLSRGDRIPKISESFLPSPILPLSLSLPSLHLCNSVQLDYEYIAVLFAVFEADPGKFRNDSRISLGSNESPGRGFFVAIRRKFGRMGLDLVPRASGGALGEGDAKRSEEFQFSPISNISDSPRIGERRVLIN